MQIEGVYASAGDPTVKRINQIMAVVTGGPIDALAYRSQEIAKGPGWHIVDVESPLIGSFRGVFSTTEVMMARRDLSTRSREEIVRIARSARGMWADREDLSDTVEYVNRLRASWERRAEDLGIA